MTKKNPGMEAVDAVFDAMAETDDPEVLRLWWVSLSQALLAVERKMGNQDRPRREATGLARVYARKYDLRVQSQKEESMSQEQELAEEEAAREAHRQEMKKLLADEAALFYMPPPRPLEEEEEEP